VFICLELWLSIWRCDIYSPCVAVLICASPSVLTWRAVYNVFLYFMLFECISSSYAVYMSSSLSALLSDP
jgi:hypothetical protein